MEDKIRWLLMDCVTFRAFDFQSENYVECKCGVISKVWELDVKDAEQWHAEHITEQIMVLLSEDPEDRS